MSLTKMECGVNFSTNLLKDNVNGLIDIRGLKNKIVLLGDSITAQNNSTATDVVNTLNAGFFTVANIQLGSFFNVVKNAGISGQRTDEILARFDSDVKALNPDWVFLLAGANDLLASIPIATIKQNLTDLYDALDGIGVKVITATQYASSSFPSQSDLGEMNRFIKNSAESRGYFLADFSSATTDPNNNTYPFTYSGVTYDGLHINAYGAKFCGDEVYRVLSKFVSKSPLLPSKSDASNKTLNPLNFGTAGVINNGATGVAPNDWNVFVTSIPVGSTVASSVISGVNSNTLRLDITGSNALTTFSRVACSAPSNSKSYYAIAEVKCNLVNSTEVSLRLRSLGGTTTKTAYANRTYADNKVVPVMIIDGVIITPILENVNGTSLVVDVFASGSSGYVEIGRVGVIQVN